MKMNIKSTKFLFRLENLSESLTFLNFCRSNMNIVKKNPNSKDSVPFYDFGTKDLNGRKKNA
jgi:hypothetical protein